MIELSDGNVNLIISDNEIAALRGALGNLTANDGIECALLIDTAGKVIAVDGSAGRLDTATIAALAAGDYATTRALARRVGEKEFSLVFQREKFLNAYLHAVSEEALLVVLFTEGIPVGGVRVAVKAAQTAIRKILLRANRTITGPEEVRRLLADHDDAPAGAAPATAPSVIDRGPITPAEDRIPGGGAIVTGRGPETENDMASSGASGSATASHSSPVASSSSSSSSPSASAPSSSAPSAPAADQIRAFWRIKGLAEDCLRIGVPTSRPKEWMTARDRISRATAELAGSTPERAGALLVEAEGLLRLAYESALALNRHAQSGDQEWEGVLYLHQLQEISNEPFTRILGENGMYLFTHIDRESIERHPAILSVGTAGRIEKSTLAALNHLTPDARRQAVARAMIDVLINRLMVVRKIFGVEECRKLLSAWKEHASVSSATLTRLGLHPVIRFLFDDAAKRWPDVRERSA